MRISDWSSDVCSSDLLIAQEARRLAVAAVAVVILRRQVDAARLDILGLDALRLGGGDQLVHGGGIGLHRGERGRRGSLPSGADGRLVGSRAHFLAHRKTTYRFPPRRCRSHPYTLSAVLPPPSHPPQ